MIMADDNANYDRVKRWREKHRGLANLRQREYRKKLRGDVESKVCTGRSERENDRPTVPAEVGEIPTPAALPFETKKVGEFRMLVMPEKVEDEAQFTRRGEMPATKPLIFRDDNGRTITERAWNALQRLKEKAKENEYEIDDYIQ